MLKPKWEYCECGCKGYFVNNTGLWYYWDLRTNEKTLFIGHGFIGKNLGTFMTTEQVDNEGVLHILREIEKLKSALVDEHQNLEDE
jgi:hypothetical protein